MSAPGFWDDPEKAQEGGRKRARVEKRIASGESIESKSEELEVLIELEREGESVDADVASVLDALETEVNAIELTIVDLEGGVRGRRDSAGSWCPPSR